MGLQEKTELYLELFGNTLIRQQTSDYVVAKANEFIRMVTDLDYMATRMPIIDMSALKFKERDHLEAIFKFWRNPDRRIFDVSKYWDNRLRHYLQVRYDSRRGTYDWDYNMKLLDCGASIIHSHDYARWRETGVAFEVREGTYDVPNKTLASGLVFKSNGEKIANRGYWGDIVSSPYLAHGIESEETSLLKKANGVYTTTAQGISEYNLLSMLHELTTKERYVRPQPKQDDKANNKPGSAKLEEITEKKEEEEKEVDIEEKIERSNNNDACHQEEEEEEKEVTIDERIERSNTDDALHQDVNGNTDRFKENIVLEDVKINFLPLGCIADLQKKAKFRGRFDLVYFSNSMVHHLTQDICAIMADHATVITETARFMLELKVEQCQEFMSKVTGMAVNIGCEEVEKCQLDASKQSFQKFKFERKT